MVVEWSCWWSRRLRWWFKRMINGNPWRSVIAMIGWKLFYGKKVVLRVPEVPNTLEICLINKLIWEDSHKLRLWLNVYRPSTIRLVLGTIINLMHCFSVNLAWNGWDEAWSRVPKFPKIIRGPFWHTGLCRTWDRLESDELSCWQTSDNRRVDTGLAIHAWRWDDI